MAIKIILKTPTKIGEHIPSTIPSFKKKRKKNDVYWCENCLKKFCKSLREYAMKIMNF